MKKLTTTLCFLLLSSTAYSAEADHYTSRDKPLQEISGIVNAKANQMLAEGVAKANKEFTCNQSKKSEKELYKILRTYFGNHSKGKLSKYLLYTKASEVPKRVIPLKESIYGQWSIWNGYLLGKRSAAKSPLSLSPMVLIGDQLIGIDKFEHMFGMGFAYFNNHYLKGKSLKRVLKKGIVYEKTILGGNVLATGVFAYADLAANFNGMRFWNHMLQKRDDVLGKEHNLGPYVTFNDGQWQVSATNTIDFTKYVDASMDESINCSKFASNRGLEKFNKGLKKISDKDNNASFNCPMNQNSLQSMLEKYNIVIKGDKKKRTISHWIINEEGPGQVSYFKEFR